MREDWIRIELGKIIKVSSGNGLTANKMSGNGYPVYGGNGITGYHSEYLFEDPKLIIGRVGVRCGVTHITKPKSWVTDNALVVNFKIDGFDLKFMQYKLQFENLNKISNSTAQPVISGSKIYAYTIWIPPLPEQRAIVAKIEQLFSELDNGIANLKAAKDKLEIYRQAVLKKAFEGELTKEWREKSKNWEVGSLERLANIIDPQPSHRTPPKSDDGVPYIGVADFDKVSGKINFESARKVGKYVLEEHIERYRLNEGDFVIGKIGTIGKPFFVPVRRFYTLSANVVLIQPIKKIADSKYLFYLVLSPIIEEQFKKGSKATTQAAFGIKKVRLLNIPICSMEEQVSIVQEIESRLSVCDNIIVDIDEGLEKAEALRQSILKQAFEGKLLSETELQACRKESDWEPAEKLLSRIELEKEKL